jgi:hypothetical protein
VFRTRPFQAYGDGSERSWSMYMYMYNDVGPCAQLLDIYLKFSSSEVIMILNVNLEQTFSYLSCQSQISLTCFRKSNTDIIYKMENLTCELFESLVTEFRDL